MQLRQHQDEGTKVAIAGLVNMSRNPSSRTYQSGEGVILRLPLCGDIPRFVALSLHTISAKLRKVAQAGRSAELGRYVAVAHRLRELATLDSGRRIFGAHSGVRVGARLTTHARSPSPIWPRSSRGVAANCRPPTVSIY